jgi:sialidase-1
LGWFITLLLAAGITAGCAVSQRRAAASGGQGALAMQIAASLTVNGREQRVDCRPYLGTWEARDGEFAMVDPRLPVSGDIGGLGLPLRVSGDFELECEFLLDKGEGNGAGGPVIAFAAKPDGSRYEFRYISDFNVCVVQHKIRGRPWQEIGYAADIALAAQTWHALALRVHGERFSVAVNGAEVVAGEGGSLGAGALSLGCTVRPVRFRKVSVRGDGVAAGEAPGQADDRTVRVVCADAGLGGYQGFPRLCRLRHGDILCAFYAGWSHTSPPGTARPNGGGCALCRSADGGRTWTEPTIVLDSPYDDSAGGIWQDDEGVVRLLAYGLDHAAWPSLKDYTHYFAMASDDDGRTWGALAETAVGGVRVGELNPWTTPRHLANGEWLLPVYWAGGAAGASYAQWRFRAGFSRSTDGGRTWGAVEYIDDTPALMDEGDVCQFPDGSILCVLRDERQHMWQTWSSDHGHTWSRPAQTRWYGHSPNLLRLRSGITLLAHRVPGLTLRYSLDNATTWAGAVMLDPAGGAYSSMVELPDGRVLIAYYTEGSRSQIRVQTLEVRRSGVVAVSR